MEKEVDVVERTGKEIHLSEIFFVFCRNIVWMILLFAVIFGVGLGFALNSKPYYTSQADATVKVKVTQGDTPQSEDSRMAQLYVKPIAEFLSTPAFISHANYYFGTYADASEYTDSQKKVVARNFSVSYNNDSFIIRLKYKDSDKRLAELKLKAIVETIAQTVNRQEGGESFYFGASAIMVTPIEYHDDGEVVSEAVQGSNKTKIILISAGIGIVAVIALTFCLLIFGDKVSSVSKLESVTGKKNFITIEKKHTRKNANKAKYDPENKEPEFLRFKVNKLSDTLIYLKDGDRNKVYQIQSATSGEGKTTVTVNLAINLGSDDRKVVIIDCDFSHPTIHRAFKISKKVGITDYFKGELDFDGMVKHTSFKNVDIITCGDRIYDHTIFFTSDKFKSIIDTARQKYDFVLLDCAPVKALSDYINVSPLADATLLVVESNCTSARDLRYIVDELQSCNANLIGTVFNFSSTSFGKEYYYNYQKSKDNEVNLLSDSNTEVANSEVENNKQEEKKEVEKKEVAKK